MSGGIAFFGAVVKSYSLFFLSWKMGEKEVEPINLVLPFDLGCLWYHWNVGNLCTE